MDDITVRMKGGSFYLFTDPATGLLYGFCDKACQTAWAETEHSLSHLGETWGCYWCGKSMNPDYEEAS